MDPISLEQVRRAPSHLVLLVLAHDAGDREVTIDQPPRPYREEAEAEFEAAGFDLEQVPWGAIAERAFQLKEEEGGDHRQNLNLNRSQLDGTDSASSGVRRSRGRIG
jgi:hypothetical protein